MSALYRLGEGSRRLCWKWDPQQPSSRSSGLFWSLSYQVFSLPEWPLILGQRSQLFSCAYTAPWEFIQTGSSNQGFSPRAPKRPKAHEGDTRETILEMAATIQTAKPNRNSTNTASFQTVSLKRFWICTCVATLPYSPAPHLSSLLFPSLLCSMIFSALISLLFSSLPSVLWASRLYPVDVTNPAGCTRDCRFKFPKSFYVWGWGKTPRTQR